MVARASGETRSYMSPYSFSFQRLKKRCAVSRGVLGGSGCLPPAASLPEEQAKAATSATIRSVAGRREVSQRMTASYLFYSRTPQAVRHVCLRGAEAGSISGTKSGEETPMARDDMNAGDSEITRRTLVREAMEMVGGDGCVVSEGEDLAVVSEKLAGIPGVHTVAVVDGEGRLVGVIPMRLLVDELFLDVAPEEFLVGMRDIEDVEEFSRISRARTAGELVGGAAAGAGAGRGGGASKGLTVGRTDGSKPDLRAHLPGDRLRAYTPDGRRPRGRRRYDSAPNHRSGGGVRRNRLQRHLPVGGDDGY